MGVVSFGDYQGEDAIVGNLKALHRMALKIRLGLAKND